MSTLNRRENNALYNRQTGNTWDPFRLMESMFQLSPRYTAEAATYLPHFDVKETKDSYVFTADLPGVKEEDLDISLTGNQLTISGKRESVEQKDTERYHVSERTYGRFTRAFTLPDGISAEHVTANLKEGVLTLSVGKRPEVQPRKIKVGEKTQASA